MSSRPRLVLSSLAKLSETLPPAEELYGMYEQERLTTQHSASAVALLASAYGCSPDFIRSRVLLGLDKSVPVTGAGTAASGSASAQEVSIPEEVRPPLPPPTRPPPGLDLFPAEPPLRTSPQLVAPSLAGKPNPLFGE